MERARCICATSSPAPRPAPPRCRCRLAVDNTARTPRAPQARRTFPRPGRRPATRSRRRCRPSTARGGASWSATRRWTIYAESRRVIIFLPALLYHLGSRCYGGSLHAQAQPWQFEPRTDPAALLAVCSQLMEECDARLRTWRMAQRGERARARPEHGAGGPSEGSYAGVGAAAVTGRCGSVTVRSHCLSKK
jgi:hypothetical protein